MGVSDDEIVIMPVDVVMNHPRIAPITRPKLPPDVVVTDLHMRGEF